MCGIAGFIRSCAPAADLATLKQMGEVIRHRGPDSSGEYLDDAVGLAHRRLSIIDLSAHGNQPMFSADGRYVIVFNGEIYNFRELRNNLEAQGHHFTTATDTEVLLQLFAAKGSECFKELNGMFALAIWDKLEKKLVLARDRIGKKPLYYYHGGGDHLAFASELKSLLQLPGLTLAPEPTAVIDFLKYHYIPAPKTIYRSVYKLLPGHYLTLEADSSPTVSQYWDVTFAPDASITMADAADQLLELLQSSTSLRMVADVPLGAFLSGGVDSSAVVALMAQASATPVRTCTIGFVDKQHDESPFAREVAELFATDHHEYQVSSNLFDTISLLPQYFDEPFADSSAVPTWHVSRLARQAVTVALAGDGGDESFAGYAKYAVELKEAFVREHVPSALLRFIQRGTAGFHHPLPRKAHSLSGSALLDPGRAFYRTNTYIEDNLLNELLAPSLATQVTGYDPAEATLRHYQRQEGGDHVSRMIYTDLKTYLPDDILVKVDRMSMAHSLEVRAPFLDYRIIEFAARLPSRFKISGNDKKILLRRTFTDLLPQHILNRRKQGFSVPLESWFRHEIKDYAYRQFFESEQLAQWLNIAALKNLWNLHQSAKADVGTILWSLLMLSLWQQEYLS